MKQIGVARAFILTLAFCGLFSKTAPAQTCVKELPTRVRHICGMIVSKEVRNATVTLMHNGTLVERQQITDDKAFFDFTKKLTDGSYDVSVEAVDHVPAQYRLIVHKPIQECSKGMLLLTMPLRAECGDIQYHRFRYLW